MKDTKKYYFLPYLIIGILLMVFPSSSLASNEPDFDVGALYTFGLETIILTKFENAIGIVQEWETLSHFNITYRIDSYDADNNILNCTIWDKVYSNEIDFWDFPFHDFREGDELSLNMSHITQNVPFLSIQAGYDSETDKVYLTNIWPLFVSTNLVFLSPNWDVLNNNIKRTTFNTSSLIRSLGNEKNLTMGDFFASCDSYELMGADNVIDARTFLTDVTRKWNGSFNFGTNFYFRDEDNSSFKKYSDFKFSFSVEYSQGGILQQASYEKIMVRGTEVYHYKQKIQIGGIEAINGILGSDTTRTGIEPPKNYLILPDLFLLILHVGVLLVYIITVGFLMKRKKKPQTEPQLL